MSVKIRLTRMGRRNRPFYRVVIADSRSRRDGRFIEQIGTYDPIKTDNNFAVKEERVFHWLKMGAKPSDTMKRLLAKEGIMLKWHLENSNISEDKKKQEIQKWEMAKANKEKAKAEKKAVKKEKEEEKEEVAEAPAEEAVEEKVEAVEKAEEKPAEAPAEEKAEEAPAEEVKEEAPAEEKAEEAPAEEVKESASDEATADVPEAAPAEEKAEEVKEEAKKEAPAAE